jgi:6-pyruvoyltetrahydropterin/6-carboxytetrahydropterin synthase
MDFTDIKEIFAPTLAQLDHSLLNNIEGLPNPTCEHLAVWIWNQVKPKLSILSKVEVQETASSGCIYEGE